MEAGKERRKEGRSDEKDGKERRNVGKDEERKDGIMRKGKMEKREEKEKGGKELSN